MTDAFHKCRELGINLKTYAIGSHRAICPKCSHLRKTIHQRTECLSVTIADETVLWRCHHCLYSGGARLDGAGGRISEGSPPADERPQYLRHLEFWSAAGPVQGTIVEPYLAGRGLTAPAGSAVLRFHQAHAFRLDDGNMARLPTMLGIFRSILTDMPLGLHRTALKLDGSGKADVPGLGNAKKMLGRVKGGAIKLSPDEEVLEGLGICEGIETGLSIMAAGWRPVWVCGSAGAIADFPILPSVCLTVFADCDDAGLKAARTCQARWLQAGNECRLIVPRAAGTDWNDIQKGAAA